MLSFPLYFIFAMKKIVYLRIIRTPVDVMIDSIVATNYRLWTWIRTGCLDTEPHCTIKARQNEWTKRNEGLKLWTTGPFSLILLTMDTYAVTYYYPKDARRRAAVTFDGKLIKDPPSEASVLVRFFSIFFHISFHSFHDSHCN